MDPTTYYPPDPQGIDALPLRHRVLTTHGDYAVVDENRHRVILRDGTEVEILRVLREGRYSANLRALLSTHGWCVVFDAWAIEPGLQLVTQGRSSQEVRSAVAHHWREHVYSGTDLHRRIGRCSVSVWQTPWGDKATPEWVSRPPAVQAQGAQV